MRSLLLHWGFNATASVVAAYFITGLDFHGDLLHLILVAAVFGLVNSLLRPLLTVLTCPSSCSRSACSPWSSTP